ncbi:uncharacterized protein LOC143025407 isoform X2 [Oratosquilla oratoria]|uniref:uncharacterized protein LOC143025407 isoform X2 n=1 Tax=Oratosquilla oratoria TaxID=337810 RepID=UPI003F7630EE
MSDSADSKPESVPDEGHNGETAEEDEGDGMAAKGQGSRNKGEESSGQKGGKDEDKNAEGDDTDGHHEVEQIVDMQVQKRARCPVKFRVRWAGFSEKDDSWVPAYDLNCDDHVQDFLEISGRRPEYEKAMASKRKEIEEPVRHSSRRSNKVSYSELEEDEDEIIPAGTKSRRAKRPREDRPPPAPPKRKPAKKKANPSSEFEVESIVDDRVRGRFTEYKVRWKRFGPEHDSWVPESQLNCDRLIVNFLKKKAHKQEDDYEVEAIMGMREKKGSKPEYKVRWKGWPPKYDSWLPEEELNCPNILNKFLATLKKLEETQDWTVEKVLDTRERKGKTEYLIRWKGWGSGADSWEPEENLDGCKEALDKFLQSKEKEKTKILTEGRRMRAERPTTQRFVDNYSSGQRSRSRRLQGRSRVYKEEEDDE